VRELALYITTVDNNGCPPNNQFTLVPGTDGHIVVDTMSGKTINAEPIKNLDTEMSFFIVSKCIWTHVRRQEKGLQSGI
jgi:hypothetical protein